MLPAIRMRLGRLEFAIDFGSFRRITQSWAGPGWDYNFSGACLNDDPDDPAIPLGRVGVYTDGAPLPMEKAADYAGVTFDLPGSYDEATGEPYFAIDFGESYELVVDRVRFAERDGRRYRIELTGTVPASVMGQAEAFELSAWAEELPDHAHPV